MRGQRHINATQAVVKRQAAPQAGHEMLGSRNNYSIPVDMRRVAESYSTTGPERAQTHALNPDPEPERAVCAWFTADHRPRSPQSQPQLELAGWRVVRLQLPRWDP